MAGAETIRVGDRVQPSAEGIIQFPRLRDDVRATVMNILASGQLRLHRDGVKTVETWSPKFWIREYRKTATAAALEDQ